MLKSLIYTLVKLGSKKLHNCHKIIGTFLSYFNINFDCMDNFIRALSIKQMLLLQTKPKKLVFPFSIILSYQTNHILWFSNFICAFFLSHKIIHQSEERQKIIFSVLWSVCTFIHATQIINVYSYLLLHNFFSYLFPPPLSSKRV